MKRNLLELRVWKEDVTGNMNNSSNLTSNHSGTDKNRVFFLVAIFLLIINRGMLMGNTSHIALIVIVLFISLLFGFRIKVFKNSSLIFISTINALIIGFVRYPSLYDVFKDAFYLFMPIIAIYLGAIIAERFDKKTFIKAINISAIILAIFFLIQGITTQGIARLISPRETRDEYGDVLFSVIIIFSMGLYLYRLIYKKKELQTSDNISFLIQLLSLYASASRTFWVCFIIIVICMLYKIIFQNSRHIVFGIISIVVLTAGVLTINPDLRKIVDKSITEMTIREYKTAKDINNNYRGYEGYMAMKAFEAQSTIFKIFGPGFGTLVDIKNKELVGSRYIPITHNGYIYILIKLGYIGLLVYILWFIGTIRTFVRAPICSSQDEILKILSIGGVLCLLFSNSVIWGIFNTEMNFVLILIG
ncbi:MAG: O-antigen ligase family protein, partial [Muribaculaceae bacterium]